MDTLIPDMIYPVAVFGLAISGSVIILIIWFLYRHSALDQYDRATLWLMDSIIGVESEELS